MPKNSPVLSGFFLGIPEECKLNALDAYMDDLEYCIIEDTITDEIFFEAEELCARVGMGYIDELFMEDLEHDWIIFCIKNRLYTYVEDSLLEVACNEY